MRKAPAPSRREVLGLALASAILPAVPAHAASPLSITVFKDPSCGCCSGWVEHLRSEGFTATVVESTSMSAVKARLGVPDELASCHTAEIGGYVIEGHVPAIAIRRLLDERPQAIGLAAPGMPMGSPGMEGGKPEVYEVVLFAKGLRRSFGRFQGAAQV